jgi:hypothetical protein
MVRGHIAKRLIEFFVSHGWGIKVGVEPYS